MKKVTVTSGADTIEILAPEDKEMTINENALLSGVLSINEYGSSGIKIAAFRNWEKVVFDAEGAGYTITNTTPF
jgi:hypothetical protein